MAQGQATKIKKKKKSVFKARGTISSTRRSQSRQSHPRAHRDAPSSYRHHRR